MLHDATDSTIVIGQEITPQNIRIERNAAEEEDETQEIKAASSDETRRAVSVSSQTDTPAVANLTGIEGFSGDSNQGSRGPSSAGPAGEEDPASLDRWGRDVTHRPVLAPGNRDPGADPDASTLAHR
jgi:hypothetical protein